MANPQQHRKQKAQKSKRQRRSFAQRHPLLHGEWKHLATSRILIVSVIVMLFIPIMYGGFFLGSIWDPYGNTRNLPVAIVNNDTPAELNGKAIAVGDELVTILKDEKSMGWEFVSNQAADAGLESGHYYMKVVIPEDASKNVTTVTSENPSKTTIAYTTTPSRNFVGALITKQAAETISQNLSTNITTAYSKAVLSQIGELKTGIANAASGATQLHQGASQLQQGITQYTNGVAQVHTGAAQLAGSLPTQAQITQLSNGMQDIQQGILALNAAVTTPNPTIAAQQALIQQSASALQQALMQYQTSATQAQNSINALATAAAAGTPTVVVNSSDIAATLTVITSSQEIAGASATLLSNLSTLTSLLTQQQATLQTSVGHLTAGVNTFTPSALSAFNGYTALSVGSSQLVHGTAALNASSPQLTTGSSQLTTGSETLAKGLSDAATQLAMQPTGDATAEHISQPISTDHKETADVPNYGYALSPYVLSLGLYVGALVFNVIYPIRRLYAPAKNARSWWMAKMSVALAVAIGQALVLDAIMVFGLGLHPNQPVHFILLSIITSMTYMSIITFLAITLDNVGRFLAMLLLVLQLGAAGGVFPILLSAGFFQAVNPFMPMTYSIYAFREAISSGLGAPTFWLNLLVLVSIMIIVNLALIAALRLHGMRRFEHEGIDA